MTWDSWHGPMTLGHALVDVIELGMMAAAVWISGPSSCGC